MKIRRVYAAAAGVLAVFAGTVGSVFFRAAVNALLPSIVQRDELQVANALFQTTERIAEIAGGVLGATAVVVLGYTAVMFSDAASILVSGACVLLMPLAWGVGLSPKRRASVIADLRAGARYIWHTPFQRYFALLIIPGYLTLAFEALRAPMTVHTAHLSPQAYGVINSTLGVGKLLTAFVLAGLTARIATPSLLVAAYLVTGVGIAIFASAPWYWGLMTGAFVFSVGNMLTYIINGTLIMQLTPAGVLGRVLGNRQALVQGTRFVGALALGRIADVAGPPVALWIMAGVSIGGVLAVWLLTGRAAVSDALGVGSTMTSSASSNGES